MFEGVRNDRITCKQPRYRKWHKVTTVWITKSHLYFCIHLLVESFILREDSPELSVLAAVLEPALDGAIHTVPLSGAEGESTKYRQKNDSGNWPRKLLQNCFKVFSPDLCGLSWGFLGCSVSFTPSIRDYFPPDHKSNFFFFLFNASVSQIPCDAFVFINSLLFIWY